MGSETIEVDGAKIEVEYDDGEVSTEVLEAPFEKRLEEKASEAFRNRFQGVFETDGDGALGHSHVVVVKVYANTDPDGLAEFFEEFDVTYIDFQREANEEKYDLPPVEDLQHTLFYVQE